MGDCWYLPAPYEAFIISIFLMLIMVPIADFDLAFVRSMIGEETNWLDVLFGEEDSHIFYITCSNGNMRGDMATIAKQIGRAHV